jgi:hypothetical protein
MSDNYRAKHKCGVTTEVAGRRRYTGKHVRPVERIAAFDTNGRIISVPVTDYL